MFPNVFFGNVFEERTAKKASLLYLVKEMSKITQGKQYTDQFVDEKSGTQDTRYTIKTKELLDDFSGLTKKQKEDLIVGMKQILTRNYDPVKTRSGFIFLRGKQVNFLRGWTQKFIA